MAFTETFEKQLLYILCTDVDYIRNYGDMISTDYFDSPEDKLMLKLIKEYVAVYNTDITIDILINQVKDYCERNNVDEQFYNMYIKLCQDIFEIGNSITSLDFIKDNTLNFMKRQEVKKALTKCVDVLTNDGDYQQLVPILESAVAIGDTQDLGLSIADLGNLKQLYRERYNQDSLIRTNIPGYDKALLGGMGPGEVHCICAAPKGGKTTFGCNVGAFNVALRKNVFHFTLEISAIDLMLKYACILGQISYSDFFTLSDEEYKTRLHKFITTRDNLFIKYYVGSTVNCGHLRAYISRIIAQRRQQDPSFKADLIIVDYDDYLLPIKTGDQSDYNNAGYVYDDLIYLANYFDCPVLTFSQTVRAAWNAYDTDDTLITAADVAHSAKRVHKCYSFSSINFKNKAEHGILYVDRNRKGPGNTAIAIERDFKRAYFGQAESSGD